MNCLQITIYDVIDVILSAQAVPWVLDAFWCTQKITKFLLTLRYILQILISFHHTTCYIITS